MRSPLRPVASSALVLLGTLVWAFRLASGEAGWAASSGTLAGAGLLVLASVSIVGTLVAASRWARRLGSAVAATGLVLAAATPIGGWWLVGTASSGVALGALVGTTFKGIVRERPAAAGPPSVAVTLILLLVAAPALSGLISPAGVGAPEVAVAAFLFAAGAWYSKALPAALVLVRVGVPAAALTGAIAAGFPQGLVLAAYAVVLTRLAWTSGARVAVRPLVETGTRVRIPPELTPPEVLDAAGLDDRGRRRGR